MNITTIFNELKGLPSDTHKAQQMRFAKMLPSEQQDISGDINSTGIYIYIK